MKKILALVLIGVLTLALTACNNDMNGIGNSTGTNGSNTSNAATTTTISAQAETTPESTGGGTISETENGDAFTTT